MILEDTKMKKVKGKKRFFLITCLMLLCAVAGIGGVLAYFTDSEQTNNKLKVAVNDTSIEEVFPDPSFKPGSVVKKRFVSQIMAAIHMFVCRFYFQTMTCSSIVL